MSTERGTDGMEPSAWLMPMSLEGIPTAACPACGCVWLNTTVALDPETYEIVAYRLHGATCIDCGTRVTLACPPDHPDFREELF